MTTATMQNVLGCLSISIVGILGSVGTAALGNFALWIAFAKELPWIATSWPGFNAWPVLGLLIVQILSSMLLGIAIASYVMWWIADRLEAKTLIPLSDPS